MKRIRLGAHFLTVYLLNNEDVVRAYSKRGWAIIPGSRSLTKLKSYSLKTKVAKKIRDEGGKMDNYAGLVYVNVKLIENNDASHYRTGRGLADTIIHECTHITNQYALLYSATKELENLANLNSYLVLKAFDYYGVKIIGKK